MSVCMFMYVIGYVLYMCNIFLALGGIVEIILQTALFNWPKQISFNTKVCLYKTETYFSFIS